MIGHDNLEEFHDPANYDVEEAGETAPRVAFYGDLAADAAGPVLEIACGTGLVAIPIASRGLAVTGADLCRPMLEHAREKSRRLGVSARWVEGDARTLDLGATFGLVYLTGNAFQAFLQRTDTEALLATVHRHLRTDGRFAFETRNPSGHDLVSYEEPRPWHGYTSVEGHAVQVYGTQLYDPIAQVMHWTTWRRWQDAGGARKKVTRIACRFTHPAELDALLHYNGFELLHQYGDWDRSRLRAGSPSIVCVCGVR